MPVDRVLRARVRWDVTARTLGGLLGFGSIVAWPITGHPPQGPVMTYAAALLVVPSVAQAQRTRNEARDAQHARESRRRSS